MPRSAKSRTIHLLPALLLVLAVGTLSACGPEDDESEKSGVTSSSGPAQESSQESSSDAAPEPAADGSSQAASEPESEVPTDSDVGSLLEDAYAGKVTIRCTFEQQGSAGTAFIRSSAHLRMDMDTPQGEMHMLKLDRTTYMWGAGLPQGIKFDGQMLNDSFAEQFQEFTPEELAKHAEGNDVRCESYSGDDSMFAVPADVTFTGLGGQL